MVDSRVNLGRELATHFAHMGGAGGLGRSRARGAGAPGWAGQMREAGGAEALGRAEQVRGGQTEPGHGAPGAQEVAGPRGVVQNYPTKLAKSVEIPRFSGVSSNSEPAKPQVALFTQRRKRRSDPKSTPSASEFRRFWPVCTPIAALVLGNAARHGVGRGGREHGVRDGGACGGRVTDAQKRQADLDGEQCSPLAVSYPIWRVIRDRVGPFEREWRQKARSRFERTTKALRFPGIGGPLARITCQILI